MNDFSLFGDENREVELPPGLHYFPTFLTESDQQDLINRIDSHEWSLELKRRVQHYGYRYDYKARRVDPSMYLGPLPDFALEIARKLQSIPEIAQISDQLIVNEYQPGQGISAHIDCEPCFNDRIASVSLGWPYEMEFQNFQSKCVHKMTLGVGSLLVFSGDARYSWTHQIRARLQDRGIRRKRRISLTFRKVIIHSANLSRIVEGMPKIF